MDENKDKITKQVEHTGQLAKKFIEPALKLQKSWGEVFQKTAQFSKGIQEKQEEITKGISKHLKFMAEDNAQPHITNNLIKKLLKTQQPTWMYWLSFVMLILTTIASILAVYIAYTK